MIFMRFFDYIKEIGCYVKRATNIKIIQAMKQTVLLKVLLIWMMTFPQLSFGQSHTDIEGSPAEEYDFKFILDKDDEGEFYAVLTEVNDSVEDLVVPDSVKAHKWTGMYYQPLYFPLKKIKTNKYKTNTTLENLVLGNVLETIESCQGLNNLKQIVMPAVKRIKESAFWGIRLLSSVELPEIVEIGNNAFTNCYNMEKVVFGAELGKIGDNAFRNCYNLKEVALGPKLEEIGGSAFSGCKNLERVVLGPKLEKIGLGTFWGAEKLTSIELPKSLKIIDSHAFYQCDLQEVVLPDGLQEIGDFAFSFNKHLKAIHIPSQVRAMSHLGWWCTELASLTVDPKNAYYESYENTIIEKATKTVIQGCNTSRIPEGVEHIGLFAFAGFPELKEIVFPESLRTIGNFALSGCTSIRHLYIPKNVEDIGNNHPMIGCKQLETIDVAEENKTFDSRNGCHAIVRTATNTLVLAGSESTIPEGIESIGVGAFEGQDRTSVTIPASVKKIGMEAFLMCENLKDVYSLIENPMPITADVFAPLEYSEEYNTTIYEGKTLHVLPGTRNKYRQTAGWTKFVHVFEDIGNPNKIEAIPLEKSSIKVSYFDLQGRQLRQKPSKGFYIQNGEKVLIK
jgi:hypothetical protein